MSSPNNLHDQEFEENFIEPNDQEVDDEENSFLSDTETYFETANGYRMTMDLPDLDTVNRVYEYASNLVASKMLTDPANPILSSMLDCLKKSCEVSKRLLQDQQSRQWQLFEN